MTGRITMGDKGGNKSRGKTPKAPKQGLRPHEQRQQDADSKAAEVEIRKEPQKKADRKVPKL
jgi:hypothetical protein